MADAEYQQDALAELHTVNDWIRWMASEMEDAGLFFGHGTDNAWDDAAHLVLWSLHLPWQRLEQFLPARLTVVERRRLLELLEQRIDERLPVPYITGEAPFCGMSFIVNQNVLIPRSPIAELINKQFYPWLEQEPETILDLCTGSGCIGIACAAAFESAFVTLSDICEEALLVAEQNIERHEMQDVVEAVQSDLFANLQGRHFDMIVCNPPYVGADEMASLPEEYRIEPELALASGDDGLDFVRRLLNQAADHLTEGGLIVLEVGNTWVAMEEAFPEVPFTWLDFENGGHGVMVMNKEELEQYFPVDE